MTSIAKSAQRSMTTDSDKLIPIGRVEDIPEFATEAEEAEFWGTHDTSLIWDQLEDVTNNPPPGLLRRTDPLGARARKRPPPGQMDLVSLRLPADLIDGVKAVAARRHLPYQTLIRSWIAERLTQEETTPPRRNDGETYRR